MGQTRGPERASRRARPAPFDLKTVATAWLFILALVFQSVVLQSHIHSPLAESAASPATTASAASISVAAAPAKAALADSGAKRGAPLKSDSTNCFYCQQLKLAGAALLPPTPVLTTIEHVVPVEVAALHIALPPAITSHTWRSRAPPISL